MKRIFTLLVCIIGLVSAANAYDLTTINHYMKVLLNEENPTQFLIQAPNLDVNHDGAINICDVTFMIDEMLKTGQDNQINRAPSRNDDIDAVLCKIINDKKPHSSLKNVMNASEKSLTHNK